MRDAISHLITGWYNRSHKDDDDEEQESFVDIREVATRNIRSNMIIRDGFRVRAIAGISLTRNNRCQYPHRLTCLNRFIESERDLPIKGQQVLL